MGKNTMSDKELRSKIIRLAHQKPELREHLLPLVTKSATSRKVRNIMRKLDRELGSLNFNGSLNLKFEDEDGDGDLLFSCDIVVFDENHPYVQNADWEERQNNYFVSIQDLESWLERHIESAGYGYGNYIKFQHRVQADEMGHIENRLFFLVQP